MKQLNITNTSSQKVQAPKPTGSTRKPTVVKSGDARGGEPLYVVTCFSDRDKLLDLPCVKKEAL